MANNDFDRTIINVRERPLSSDIDQALSQLDRTMRDFLDAHLSARQFNPRTSASDARVCPVGFLSDGFKADPGAGLQTQLRAGIGFMNGTGDQPSGLNSTPGLDDLARLKPVILMSPVQINHPAADPGNPRIDLIELKYNRKIGNPLSRDVLNIGTGIFNPTMVNKTLSYVLDGSDVTTNGTGAINLKTGTPNAVPVKPTVDAGYIPLAYVRVNAAAVALDPSKIGDWRKLLGPNGQVRVTFDVAWEKNPATWEAGSPTVTGPAGIVLAIQLQQGTIVGDATHVVFQMCCGNLFDNLGNGIKPGVLITPREQDGTGPSQVIACKSFVDITPTIALGGTTLLSTATPSGSVPIFVSSINPFTLWGEIDLKGWSGAGGDFIDPTANFLGLTVEVIMPTPF